VVALTFEIKIEAVKLPVKGKAMHESKDKEFLVVCVNCNAKLTEADVIGEVEEDCYCEGCYQDFEDYLAMHDPAGGDDYDY
jgi:hypothetical protein